MTSRRPFLLLRICFPGRPIFIQLPPGRVGAARPGRQPAHGQGLLHLPQRPEGRGDPNIPGEHHGPWGMG